MRGKAFGQERAERLVFPGLDIARRPVVEQAQTKHVVFRLGDVDRLAQLVAGADENAQLQFDIHARAGLDGGHGGVRRLGLADRALEGLARDDDAGCTAVVADRNPLVVGQQRVVWAELLADVGGVVDGGVEIGVIANAGGHAVLRLCLRHQAGLPGALLGTASAQAARECQAQRAPVARAQRHQAVELGLRTGLGGLQCVTLQSAGCGQLGQVQNLVANGDAAAHGFVAALAFEAGKRQILDGEIAAGGIGAGQPALQLWIVGFVQLAHVLSLGGKTLLAPGARRQQLSMDGKGARLRLAA